MPTLRIAIKKNQVLFTGSIEAEHDFDPEAAVILIKTSCGTHVQFSFDDKHDKWVIYTNRKHSDRPKYFDIEQNIEYGVNETIIFNYDISHVHVQVDGHGLRMYGCRPLTKDEQKQYDDLVRYLNGRGVICLEEIKRDLKLLVTGQYQFTNG